MLHSWSFQIEKDTTTWHNVVKNDLYYICVWGGMICNVRHYIDKFKSRDQL